MKRVPALRQHRRRTLHRKVLWTSRTVVQHDKANGAVSGASWGGAYHEFSTGYGLVDLHEGGTFRNESMTYP